MPENSVDLIVTDPPYFRVKTNDWDNQWDSEGEFLSWCDEVLSAFNRVLKPNGSLYWFAGPYMAAKLELLINKRYSVLNHIVWVKESGRHKGCRKESLRKYFPQTERIIFAEPLLAMNEYQRNVDEISGHIYQPIIDYLNNARKLSGISIKQCVELCGSSTVSHYFSRSQFHFPSQKHFVLLMKAFGMSASYDDLKGQHESLRCKYSDLRKEFDKLKRPFSVTKDVPFTDVWDFPPVQPYKGKHPCEKPLDLIKHMITASSLPGQVVFDGFVGSGAVGVACVETGRDFIGVEADVVNYKNAQSTINQSQKEFEH